MRSKVAKSDLFERDCWEAIKPGFLDVNGKDIAADKLDRTQSAKNDRVLAYIFKSVEHHCLEDIGVSETAKDAWKALEEINTDFTVLHTLMHLKEMVNAQKGADEPM